MAIYRGWESIKREKGVGEGKKFEGKNVVESVRRNKYEREEG